MKIVEESVKNELCSRIGKYESRQYSFHWHNCYEICRLESGSCSFLVDGRLIEAEVGDIITVDEQTVHRFIVDKQEARVRIIQLPLSIVLNTGIGIRPIRTHITASEIASVDGLGETLNALFAIMDREGAATSSDSNPFLRELCSSLYFLLMRHFPTDGREAAVSNDRMTFFKITEYVNLHFRENINVNSISASLYIPRGRLTNLFTKYSGGGLNAYINGLRINNANRLMKEGRNVTEAALESGFQSIRTFNNTYKTHTGMTPSEFIGKHR